MNRFEFEASKYIKQQIAANEDIKFLRGQHQADLDVALARYGEFETNGALACFESREKYFQQDCLDTVYEIVNRANAIFNVALAAEDFVDFIRL